MGLTEGNDRVLEMLPLESLYGLLPEGLLRNIAFMR